MPGDMQEALNELRHHWGSAYVIACTAPGVWLAQRKDTSEVLRAGTPDELRDVISADYRARPVAR
jgi:hypothetical protein